MRDRIGLGALGFILCFAGALLTRAGIGVFSRRAALTRAGLRVDRTPLMSNGGVAFEDVETGS